MINSRELKDLTPEVQAIVVKLFIACQKAGLKILITSTYRDVESQNALYAQGRTTAGHIVTNAKGGQSAHQYHIAFDFVPLDAKGQPDWNDLEKFKKVGALGEALGLTWGGNFTTIKDMPHFQLKTWKQPK